MKNFIHLPALICLLMVGVGCASNDKIDRSEVLNTPPLHGPGGQCWDGSWIDDLAEGCPLAPESIKRPDGSSVQPAPELASPSPNELGTCWDGTIRTSPIQCIDRPLDPRTGKPAP